jgi:hypothetical protein
LNCDRSFLYFPLLWCQCVKEPLRMLWGPKGPPPYSSLTGPAGPAPRPPQKNRAKRLQR